MQIKNAVFKDAGSVFQASTNYDFTSDGVDGVHKEDEIPDTIDYLNWKKEKNMR